jgi:hypothetical protein
MKRLFTSSDQIAVAQLKGILESEGILCILKNEMLTGLAGEVPFTETFPEVWVVNPGDYDRAEAIKREWRQVVSSTGQNWTCPTCGEILEPQFSSCWRCNAPRLESTAAA